MEVDDDDFFVVIIGDEDKQKQKSKEDKKSKLQSTRNNTEEINEKANFTSALDLIDNANQHVEVKTEPVETVETLYSLEEGECLSIKSEPEDAQEDEFNLQTDEKFESSTDDNLLVEIPTDTKIKRVLRPNKTTKKEKVPISTNKKRKRGLKPNKTTKKEKVPISTNKKRKRGLKPNKRTKKKKVPVSTNKKRKRGLKPNKRTIKENIMVEIPTDKKKRRPLKQEECRSYIEELRQQFPELKDEDLLVETLRGILGEVKAPPPPKEYFIMNDTMYECLFCNANTCTARMAEVHYQEVHGPTYLFCFACGNSYRRKPYLYGHEILCKAKDAPILLKARNLLLKRVKTCVPESESTVKEETHNIKTEEEEILKSEPAFEEETPNIDPEYEEFPKSEPTSEKDDPSINTEEEEFPMSEPAHEEGDNINTEEEFLDSDNQEESESDNKITIEIPKYDRRKARRGHIMRSYIEELRQQYPELRADKELLIDTLTGIMRTVKPPPPAQDYFIMNGVMFECTFCGVETNTLAAAARHFQHKHGTRYLVCFACGVDFMSTTELYKHEKRCWAPDAKLMLKARAGFLGPRGRNRPFLTEHKFRMSSSHVKRVRRRYVKSPDRYKCDMCSTNFTSSAALESHQHLHNAVRPYVCRYCPTAYTSKIALNHHKANHTDVEFICDHCTRSFKRKKTLVVHMATHYPVSSHICEYCGRNYIQKMSLTQHVNRKHLKLTPTFLCHICDKRYWKNSTLKMHMQREHESTLVTRTMFIKKLPTLTEAEMNEAKLIYDSDFTNINDTVLLPEGGVVVKPPPEKKKQVTRKRKAENGDNEKKKKAKKGEIKKPEGENNQMAKKGEIEKPQGENNHTAKKGEIEKPEGDNNPKTIIKNLSKDVVVKKIKQKKEKKINERDVIKFFAIQPMDDVVTLNEGPKRKYKTNETPKKIYFSNIHKPKPRTEGVKS